MKTPEALDIVLKLAKFGDSIAQAKGLNGKRLSDIERDNNIEAIEEVELLSKSYEMYEDEGDQHTRHKFRLCCGKREVKARKRGKYTLRSNAHKRKK